MLALHTVLVFFCKHCCNLNLCACGGSFVLFGVSATLTYPRTLCKQFLQAGGWMILQLELDFGI